MGLGLAGATMVLMVAEMAKDAREVRAEGVLRDMGLKCHYEILITDWDAAINGCDFSKHITRRT